MKAKVIKNFRDLKEDISRQTGDVFVLNKDRYEEITKKLPGFIEEVEEVQEVEEKPKKKTKRSK